MGAAREKDQADFDLEAFIELFDEALTSDDPSVQKALQHLMVICALTRSHDPHNVRVGPMRRMAEDQKNILRRLESLEVANASFNKGYNPGTGPYGPGTVTTPWVNPSTGGTPIPGTSPYNWPHGPGITPIWSGTGSSTSATSISMSADSATASQILNRMKSTADNLTLAKADSILKDPTYKGSTVG